LIENAKRTLRQKTAWGHFKAGDLKQAWHLSRAINRDSPDFTPAWDLSSRIALALGENDVALKLADHSLVLAPSQFDYLAQRAYCLHALHRGAEASELTDRLALGSIDLAADYDTLGNLYSLCKDQGKAESCFRKAVELEPGTAHFNVNLALSLQANGKLDEAERRFDQAIELNPSDYEAWLHRSRLRKQKPQENHIEEIKQLITQGTTSWRGEMTLRYALAKEYEDLGDYADSFAHLKLGSSLRRSHMQFDVRSDIDAIDVIIQNFSEGFLGQVVAGCDSKEPIFIVGLPRTGTTLVERILGSHSEVFAAGELNNFAENLTRQVSALGGESPANREKFIEAATAIDYAALGSAYVESTRPHTGHTPRFVDKLPLNFLYCGLILRALPNAKIVHVTRHPMDTCFAVYKTLFKQAYPYSYDLEELGQYYLAYRKMMNHWHTAAPGRIHNLSYEQLTSNFEEECKNLISYCGLAWEDGCLAFYDNTAPSMTASLAQVREPVYTSSVGRWKNYREQLQPLENILVQAKVDI
jgi:tetratricopeptide (TPR) repeat protein